MRNVADAALQNLQRQAAMESITNASEPIIGQREHALCDLEQKEIKTEVIFFVKPVVS